MSISTETNAQDLYKTQVEQLSLGVTIISNSYKYIQSVCVCPRDHKDGICGMNGEFLPEDRP